MTDDAPTSGNLTNGASPVDAPTDKFIQIDEDGYFHFDGTRVSDADYGADLLRGLFMDESGRCKCRAPGMEAWVESFDAPLVAANVERDGDGWRLLLPYGEAEPFRPGTLTLDEWDRFHGHTDRKIPFVFSRAAQTEFFNLVDAYDDESVTIAGQRHEIPTWLDPKPETRENEFWDQIYRAETPGWELNEPHPALPRFFPKLKRARSRVLVLGAGSGNDAAYLANQGHIVTAVDFSREAIARAKKKYGHIQDLNFLQADAFDLPSDVDGRFDLVFEHTFYCAVDPVRRADIMKVWRRCLADGGHLLGIFFAQDKPAGPPFGGSEWELRARLKNQFRPLYWMRLRDSPRPRLGRELLIYAEKLSRH